MPVVWGAPMMRWRTGRRAVFIAACGAFLLAACEEEPSAKVERIRAIKPYYVVEPAGGDVRRYSGTIVATNTSALSFAVSGTVQTVEVNQGDRVVKGQVLATLDTEPFDLDVAAAQSEVSSAQAEAQNQELQLDRQRKLYEKEWVAKAALDQAIAATEAAKGKLNLVRSRLGLIERDRSNARLMAPFDGVISLRDVDPFVEVQSGQTVLRLDSEGAFEVELSIPDSVIGRLTIGAPVTVAATTVAGCGCKGRITEIGTTAGAANAVPVKAAILESPGGLLPGMAVEAGLLLSDEAGSQGFLVPLVAIAPADANARGYVFKYDAENGVVRKTPIVGEGGVSGNLIGVTEGVEPGDIVAAAGVSFLRDGQPVKLLGE